MWILLIEDEARLAASVRRGLEEEGNRVDWAADAAEGERLALQNAYDVMIVDWRLPLGDGKTLVETVRAAGVDRPVLMLTALGDVEHRVAGLNAGADDYLTKPFAFDELLARLRALVRRPPLVEHDAIVRSGSLAVDAVRRVATLTGPQGVATLNLRPKEFAVLGALARNPNAALSRAVLAEQAWGDAPYVTDNAMDVTISGLRQSLDLTRRSVGATDAPWIETIRGVGYRLVVGA